MSTEGGTKAVVAALAASTGIAITKFVAFAVTGSSSMLSEAIHSVADAGNQVLLLIGGRHAQRAADAEHPFGYGRVRYVYAFIVSIVLFCLGGLFSLYEGWHKVQAPEELTSPAVAFVVLGIAIVLEGFSFRTALRESNSARGSQPLPAFVREVRQPELPVILLEDSGALVGLVFALLGVTLATVTGDGRWDGIGALAIGLLLLVIAVFLAVEMASMLVGEGAVPAQDAAIRAALEAEPLVSRLIHLRTLHTGPDEILVAAKIGVDASGSAADISAAIDAAERRVRAAVPEARWIYLEPDLDRDERLAAESSPGLAE
jgi:cation diffusion facilitator family transporter